MLVVFGLIAFDNTIAIVDTFPHWFPQASATPSLWFAIHALLIPSSRYDTERLVGVKQALDRLQRKSRSFFLASSTFAGRLRIDLILLYSFCRVADDLVDSTETIKDAKAWIGQLRHYLDLAYAVEQEKGGEQSYSALHSFVTANFPLDMQHALLQLPVSYLSANPLYDLLTGFEMDLEFCEEYRQHHKQQWPITDQRRLEQYGVYVAGTVAELCLDLAFHHYPGAVPAAKQADIKRAGGRMGVALQLVNIARDIQVDAVMGRVYIPTEWLKEHDLTPEDVISKATRREVGEIRVRLLDLAFSIYEEARSALDELPIEVRGPMRVAVESYMQIGRVLRQEGYQVKAGKATVPKIRRLIIAWRALNHA